MKVIALNGSPRKNGNTAALLGKALEGSASQKAETELIHLYDLQYKGCVSCFACKLKDGRHGACAMKDDLSPVLVKVQNADAVIFGSPIYFMNVTSGMAALWERLLFSNSIYSMEVPTVFPKVISSGVIYTMNITEERAKSAALYTSLSAFESVTGRILGKKPELLYSYDTYQYTDYSRYEHSIFSEEEKAKQRAEQFPIDCENAFQMGVRLARGN